MKKVFHFSSFLEYFHVDVRCIFVFFECTIVSLRLTSTTQNVQMIACEFEQKRNPASRAELNVLPSMPNITAEGTFRINKRLPSCPASLLFFLHSSFV